MTDELERAKQLVRDIVIGIWRQRISEAEIDRVARKIVRALPPSDSPSLPTGV